MYVESVSLTDFRCFEKASTTFVYPGVAALPEGALPNVTLLIGINGAGKTSLLKAISLGVLAPIIEGLGYRPYYLVKKSKEGSTIKLNYQIRNQDTEFRESQNLVTGNSYSNSLTIDSYGQESLFKKPNLAHYGEKKQLLNSYHSDTSPAYFMLGYGALRRTELAENIDSRWSRSRHPRFQRVASLFDDAISILPLASWYPSVKKRKKELLALLNGLLPEDTRFTGKFLDNDALFEHRGATLPFDTLSDGYRSYVGLVADLLNYLHKIAPEKSPLTEMSGVVMIDDIDVHLHPAWQREIVPKLASTFPKLQFIITTHSPLVVGTVHAANIRVVEENQIYQFTEQTTGKSADQILMSSYFGLDSPRSPATEKKLKKISKRVARTHDPKAAVEFLKELTGKK